MKKFTLFLFIFFIGISADSQTQNALNFDGANDIVNTFYDGVPGTGARTIEAWIRTEANADPNSDGVQQIIADYGSFVTGGRFTFNILWSNAIRLEVGGNGLSGSIPVNDGVWHHVAVTYNPDLTNTLSLYVDGELDVSGNVTVTLNTGSDTYLRLGRRIDNMRNYEGEIDELRFWDVALTQEELQENMNNELCEIPENVQAYYNFNEGTADGLNDGIDVLPDLSENGNDGSVIGFSLAGITSNWVEGAPIDFAAVNTTITVDVCDEYTWDENGETYIESGEYEVVYVGSNDCDSIVTLDLNVHDMDSSEEIINACDSYPWDANGVTYIESGVFEFVTTSSLGCDSTLVLDLTLSESTSSSEAIVACDSYFWDATGETYDTNGEYFTVLVNANGCDSMASIDLTLNTIGLNVIENEGGSLTADMFAESYQWLDCDNDMAAIDGATSQTFYPTQNGNYAVVITSSGCTDTTDCVNVSTIDISEFGLNSIEIFPNPARDFIQIKGKDIQRIEIFNPLGQRCFERLNNGTLHDQINLDNFASGVYQIRIYMSDHQVIRQLIIE